MDTDTDVDTDTDSDTDTDADSDTDTECGDLDDDGFADAACGGDDCDDGDETVYPGAADNEGVGEWVLETVDAAGDTGQFTSLALDAAGAAHISYRDETDGDLRYATNWVAPDGIDQNCDGVDGVDADADGYASLATGGDDCDDTDDTIHPDAADAAGDGIDQDCDGADG